MSSKEDARSAWVELVSATKDYLKLPAVPNIPKEMPARKPEDKHKEEADNKKNKKKAAASEPKKKQKLEAPPPPGDLLKLITATRAHPRYVELYVNQLAKCEEIPGNERKEGDPLHVIALDCEMIQTVEDDMALARVSAVEISESWDAPVKVVMDELVMPTPSKDYIVDTRTLITGLTVEDICARGITPIMAKDRFIQLIKPHTILMGHALDHDLLALGVKCAKIVDTAMLFTVLENSEYTHSLAHLSNAFLNASTSRNAREGVHDSVEDATLALKIVTTIVTTPVLYAHNFPIALPKEESAAKRKLASALGVQAQVLSTRIQVSEGNIKLAVESLKKS